MLREAIRHRRSRQPAARTPTARLFVRVRGGYQPSVLHAPARQPLRITFLRDEEARCSERVVFPTLGKSAMLPRGKEVVVELTPLSWA